MAKGFLKHTYNLDSAAAVRSHYDKWAASYDAEIAENGYATPRRCAEALAACAPDRSGTLLDMGCGTGLSGLAFRSQGFLTIDGCDISKGMMEKASKRGVYRALFTPDTLPDTAYDLVAAVGAIGPGAAPGSLIGTCLSHLRPGGLFVFSLNDHALEDADILAARDAALRSGTAVTRFEEHGDHLPGIDLKSTVYVFEKT